MEFEVVATLPPSIRPLEGMDCSDGLLSIEGHTVRWHSPYGRSIIREFTCDHPPLRAMFCSFPLAGESFQSSVVIVLARHKIRIIASGARYDINLNFSIRNVFSSSIGLIIERSAENAGVVVHPAEGVPLLYTITHPIMRVGYLSLPSAAWADGGADGCPVVLSARGPFLCVLDASATRVLVLKIASTQHLSRCDHNDSILNHDQPLCSPFSADVSRGSSGSRVKHAESSFDVNTGPCGHGQCDLEIRGRGFPSSARSDSFPPPPELKRIGSFNDNETNSQSLMANFASAAGENSNSAAVGGSRLRYAGGAVGRRRRFDKSKSNHRGHSDSSYGEMRVDTFYNALLGIDPSWSLQQNAAVTATWLRQASADMPSLHSGDPVDLEVDLSVNISSATPASLRGAAFETSGLSSSFLSRSDAEILSSGSSIFFSDNLTIIHVCSVLLAEKQFLSSAIEMDFKGIHLYTSRNTGTFFDRISRSGSSGSESWILSPHSVGVTASVTQIISGENVIDIIFEKSGEFFRYALPGLIQNQCHSESEIQVLTKPLLHWESGVSSTADVALTNNVGVTVACFSKSDALVLYGGEIVGTAKFPADAKLTKLLRVRTLTAPVQCAVEPFVETRFTDKLMSCSQDLLICEFANGDSNEAIHTICKLYKSGHKMLGVSSSFDKSLPWLSVPNSYKLRGCDIISERILFAAQEVLTPLLFSAVARALVVGQQQDYSVLGASPAAYILVAAFSSRIVRNFPASDRTFSFSFIYNMVRSLGTSSGTYLFEERPNTVVDKSFQFAIANVCDVFNEESSQSFVAGIKEPLKVMDGAASLFDILHVISEDMKLRDQWISGADCITIEDYMMIRRVLYCICAGGGGPECQRYLQNFADGFVVIDSLKENFILHCFSILTRRQCESKEVASFVHKHRYHFSVNAQSSDSTPICSLHWLTSGFKALNLFAASRALEPDNAPKMFPLPIRYLWSSGDVIIQASPADLPDAVTKSSLVRWCPTLHLSLRIIYYLWEAIKISNDEENSAGCEPNRLQAWRLLYAVMSSYAIDAECETPYVESETLSGMPRLISLLPRPLALAVQIAIMECAVSLPQDLLFHVNLIERSLGNKEDIGSAIPRIPRALRSRIASMDTLMLADRIDIALNSLTSILLLQKFYSANEELIAKPWEAAVRSSSVWSWSKVCQISKARRMLLDEQKGYDAVDISLHNGPRKNTFDIDGLQQMLISTYSRFPADERVREACRIVDSKKEVFLRIMRTPDMDDAAYKAKLQQRLQFYCRKSLAASIGRGMMTLSSMSALMAEPLTIPPLNLSGRVPPLGALINLESMTAEHLLWPEFHNGVAAGLRVRNSSSTSSTSELSLMQIYTDLKSKYYNRADRLHSAQLAGTSRDPHDRAMRYWVLYNHKAAADSSHAGVLLAFGLLGHLKVLSAPDISDFLTACHQPTTIAMLIGLAASRLGSSDNFTSKTICLYFPSLIPTGQSNSDIEVPVLVQAAALTGLGLLNAGSGNRIMAEFLFSELTKRPATEKGMDCREVYALSAAWALGMLAIGRGAANNKQAHDKNLNSEESEVIADLRLDVRLLRCIEGGHSGGLAYDGLGDGADKARLRSRVPNSYAMDLNANSSTIIEPEYSVNTAATSFGAIIALGLMHIQTENGAIAARLHVPETNYALESERPDLLFARALVQCLIQWKRVENACIGDASRATLWLNDQIPQVLRDMCYDSGADDEKAVPRNLNDISIRSASIAYVSIAAGYCMGIALVHAGTANEGRLIKVQKQARAMGSFSFTAFPFFSSAFVKSCAEKTCKSLVEMYVSCLSLSAGVVMAGTGDVSVLRLVRELRMKNEDAIFGSQIAAAMTAGMLFLCGGKASFKRDPISVGLLFLSICPWFPAKVHFNKSHLQVLVSTINTFQATRHLYVLAVEWRWLRCVDVDTGQDVDVEVEVHLIGRYASLLLKAPCLLPELASVESVAVHSDNFYKAELVFQPSLDDLREPFKLGYQHVTAVNRSAGQPIVLYVKKSRVGNNEQPFDYMLQNTPSPSIVSYRLFNIKDQQMRGRHLNHIAKLQDLLSLKSKSVANTLNGLPTDHSHSCLKSTSQHANHNDVSNIYSTVEEILLSGNERSKGTVAILRCLAECDFLFRDLSNVFLPTRQEPAVSDDLKCTGKVPEGVLDQYQKSDESSVYCSNTLAYPSFGNKRNLAALFFSASHPSVN